MRDGVLSEATVTYNVALDVFVVREKLGIAPVMIVARDEAITGKMPNMVIGPGVKKWMCTILAQADRGEIKGFLVCPLPMPIKVFGATEEHLRRRPFAESNEQQARTFSGTSQAAHGKMYRLCEAAMKGRKMTMKLVDDILDDDPPPSKWPPRIKRILWIVALVWSLFAGSALVADMIKNAGVVEHGPLSLIRWGALAVYCAVLYWYFLRPALRWWRSLPDMTVDLWPDVMARKGVRHFRVLGADMTTERQVVRELDGERAWTITLSELRRLLHCKLWRARRIARALTLVENK